MVHFKRSSSTLSAAVACALLAGCGGGGGGDSEQPSVSTDPVVPVVVNNTPPAPAVESTFPTGLAVASPAELSSTQTVASVARPDKLRYAADWGRALIRAVRQGDAALIAGLTAELLPISVAHAAAGDRLELKSLSTTVQQVLGGDSSINLEVLLNMNRLFSNSGNASCYGPSMLYSTHQDAGSQPASGTLPGGDLGMWTEFQVGGQAGGQPCVAAQLNSRTAGVKAQTMQGLLLMAALRQTVASSPALSMPAAGATTDVSAQFESMLRGYTSFASWDVYTASISLNSAGTTYTYRLTLTNGATGASARLGEVIMQHTPGSSAASYTGLMHIAAFSLSNDSAMGCDDEKDSATNLFKAAHVSTLRYGRDGAAVTFGNRGANYCGHPAATDSSNYGADVASYTAGGELDPAVKLSGNAAPGQPRTRGTSKGWLGGFTRFGGDFNADTAEGDFLYAWQAGTGDDKSRMFAVDTSYNTVTDSYDLQGFFGFAADIATTQGNLLGMICNWAGPGNNHTPTAKFQSQRATLSSGSTIFTVPAGGSKIAYAPTNSCSSTLTSYDVNVDNTLSTLEGVGTTAALDAPSDGSTVQQELESRGFAVPDLF